MTQNEKDLLLKDLSSRLPYGVKVKYENEIFDVEYVCPMYEEVKLDIPETWTVGVSEVKPYLFPMSSMTEKQKKEYNGWKHIIPVCHYEYGDVVEEDELWDSPWSYQYLIENHFDCNDLIPLGLAIDATNKNIY
jgi:hypothetical protein